MQLLRQKESVEMSEYSPGPWELLPRNKYNNLLTVTDKDGGPVAYIETKYEEHANWRLIAAAPELHNALKYMIDIWYSGNQNEWEELLSLAESALEKAKVMKDGYL